MKRGIWILSMLALLLALSACGGNRQVKQEVTEDIQVFTGGSMEDINTLLFGDLETQTGKGFLAELFAMSEVTVKKVEKDSVILEITAPDMSDFFTANADTLASITTSEEMKAAVLAHAAAAQTVTTQVSLPYTLDGETLIIDYTDAAFIDAMTGGLASAYAAVYIGMIEAMGG